MTEFEIFTTAQLRTAVEVKLGRFTAYADEGNLSTARHVYDEALAIAAEIRRRGEPMDVTPHAPRLTVVGE